MAERVVSWSLRLLGAFESWLLRGSEARWFLVSLVACLILPPAFSWPTRYPEVMRSWERIVLQKVADPSFDYAAHYEPAGNAAKRNYRLVVPAFAWLTGTGIAGVHAFRFALQPVLLAALLLAARRASRCRLTALYTALAVAGTHVGTSVWIDWGLWFDNCAHAFMALAMACSGFAGVGLGLLLALLTDERALIAVPLLVVFHAALPTRSRVAVAALAGALVAYAALRLWMTLALGFRTPLAGVLDQATIRSSLRSMPLVVLFALEGGWLLVGLAAASAWKTLRPAAGAAFFGLTVLTAFSAISVLDLTRSAAYCFPATLAAVAIATRLRVDPGRLRQFSLWAAGVSLVLPNRFIVVDWYTHAPVQHNVLVEILSRLLARHLSP